LQTKLEQSTQRFRLQMVWMVLLYAVPFCFVQCFVHSDAAEPIDFQKDVAPILERACLRCHSEIESKGDFSLQTAAALRESEYVVPSNVAESHFINAITPDENGKAQMPKDGQPLSPREIATIKQWIEEGAKWPSDVRLTEPAVSDLDWWSLKPIVAHAVPNSEGARARRIHPVDAFIDAQLSKRGLKAVERADAVTLVRRVTYDLTGLPPTIAELDAFADAAEADFDSAWSALVDRLLASPAFGEKWGQHWLDLARYAETHGYDKDKMRNQAWPFRDYVIRSFNEDKPFDRFVQEQVAGDVLFSDSPDGVLGLGFLAAGPWDLIGHLEVGEGKVDGRIAKHLDRDEMVSAVFNVFMSTTVQCAQCHHHKFDPIKMEDYYRLHAVFAAVDRADRVYDGLSPDQQHKKRALLAKRDQLKSERISINARRKKELAPLVGPIDQRLKELAQKKIPQPVEYGFHSSIVPKSETVKWLQVDLGKDHQLDEVRLIPAYDEYANIGAGFGFPIRYKVEGSNDPEFNDREQIDVLLDATAVDQPNPGLSIITAHGSERPVRYLRVTATKLTVRSNDFIFALGELEAIEHESGDNVALKSEVTSSDSIEAKPRWGRTNLVDGIKYSLFANETDVEEYVKLKVQRRDIEQRLNKPEEQQNLSEIATKLAAIEKQLSAFPKGKTVYATTTQFQASGQFKPTSGTPRPIHLLHRGDMRSPGDRMLPGVPTLWESMSRARAATESNSITDSNPDAEPFTYDEGTSRAELARYLTRRDNPLVWRSMANRIWQWTFGQPLVGTPNDFGRMGMLPSHPELLDHLAARLRDDPQHSIKNMVRLLVTSRAYQRASIDHSANAKLDAGNQFLWRYNRRRLTAEELRDTVLSVSGVMKLEPRGGPSFKDFVVEKPQHSPHYEYHLHDPFDTSSHRRTVYRFVVRSQPQPMLTTLDCADPSISVPMRDESTTALQALTQWNHQLVVAMSSRFAERLHNAHPDDLEQRIIFGCRLTWGRSPTTAELEILNQLTREQGDNVLARVLLNTSAMTYLE